MVMNDSGEKREAISWNIVAQNSDFISSLLQQATRAGLGGKLSKKFFLLQAVRDNINFSLSIGERKSFDEQEFKFMKICTYLKLIKVEVSESREASKKLKKDYNTTFFNKVKLIKKYHHNLMDCLEALGYFPKKENRENMSF